MQLKRMTRRLRPLPALRSGQRSNDDGLAEGLAPVILSGAKNLVERKIVRWSSG